MYGWEENKEAGGRVNREQEAESLHIETIAVPENMEMYVTYVSVKRTFKIPGESIVTLSN